MKRFMQLTIVAASLALSAGVVAAQGGIRPDDRPTHGVGSISPEASSGVVRPDDRATHRPGATPTAITTVSIRPDDRATHGPGTLSDTATRPVRPDDRAWRGVGPAPTSAVSDVQPPSRDGFDWADAGIGALAAFGFGLLLVGVALVALRRQWVASFS